MALLTLCLPHGKSYGNSNGENDETSDAIIGKHARIVEIVASFGYKNARIFGSASKNIDTEDSDLDMVVERGGGECSLLRLGQLGLKLEEELGVKVDIKTEKMIPARARNRILSESIPL